ncbi:MAG: hypothetical protein E7Z91_05240 [Cyanobacteria bacterium SIG30]|nr:hypothetical protein [Cyanobacteria bacterium SIG30]
MNVIQVRYQLRQSPATKIY